MKKSFKTIGYILYAVLTAVVLLYVRFPSASLQATMAQRAERMTPPILLKTESLDPAFPPGVHLKGPSFFLKDTPRAAVFESKALSIHPEMTALLTGKGNWRFDAAAYGGTIRGRVSLKNDGSINGFDLSFENIRIQDYAFLPDFGIGNFSGRLNGKVSFNGPLNRFTAGDGTGKIHISEGNLDLLTPILGLEAIPFGDLKAGFTLKKGAVHLSSVTLDGKGFQGSLAGTVYLNRIVDRSRLNLKGTIEPIAPYLETLKGGPALLSLFTSGPNKTKRSFVIQGTLRSPRFRFI